MGRSLFLDNPRDERGDDQPSFIYEMELNAYFGNKSDGDPNYPKDWMSYPLVNVYVTMENHHAING